MNSNRGWARIRLGVGLVSGAKIVDILKKNTDMDPEKYEMICGAPASQFVTLIVLGLFESHEEGSWWEMSSPCVRCHGIDAYTVTIADI